MKKCFFAVFAFLVFALSASAQFGADPFSVEVKLDGSVITVNAVIPAKHYLYPDHFKIADALGNPQLPISLPETANIIDPNSGKPKPVFAESFSATYEWNPSTGGEGAIRVEYWGCNDAVCFIPQSKVIELKPADNSALAPVKSAQPETVLSADWKTELENWEITGNSAGYMKADAFVDFLNRAENGGEIRQVGAFKLFLTDPVAFVREKGFILALVFILFGGLLLNLTPCVLPMIPINLAIIGAGAQAGSKGRGFALGAVYGLGIALVYGLLGVIVVLTGSKFGAIQSSPWFNLSIALIFVALALAMFDIIHIDFSRFQTKLGGGEQKPGNFLVAFTMGSVAALLAGACVAPVVIAVLLLSTSVYEANPVAGLILPFVLGIGMALPWPFAGAGLSFLPKPGKWMEKVKYAFGAGIILFALYYANLSIRGFLPARVTTAGEVEGHHKIDGATNTGFAQTLIDARTEGKPVFIDFWASWCKNCTAMDKTTFKDEVVKARLEEFTFIKYVAENTANPETKAVMDHFGVQGMPTFIVLRAK